MTSKHALSTGKILIKLWDFQKVKGGFLIHRLINLQLSGNMTLSFQDDRPRLV